MALTLNKLRLKAQLFTKLEKCTKNVLVHYFHTLLHSLDPRNPRRKLKKEVLRTFNLVLLSS